jgi:hypothetical protein
MPFAYVGCNGVGIGYAAYAEPIYQWQPEPDEPVLWWSDNWDDSEAPDICAFRIIPEADWYRICKPVIVSPYTVGECRRRLAAGELEEYKP